MREITKEPQYTVCIDESAKCGDQKMGYMSSFVYRHDPKRLAFMLSRYKFVAKMFEGFSSVLEIGCADAFGSTVVGKEVGNLVCSDFDPIFIEQAKQINTAHNIQFRTIDFTKEFYDESFDGIYALDVLEHIDKANEDMFLKNIIHSLNPESGSVILGMPSIESQQYASKESKEGHVNCKSGHELKTFLKKYFSNVFIFSMSDEVVHTGYYPMAHYLIALCANPKARHES
jgi:2-polyprenyl-3-methyl-5-hydroxy-6-metoxy-1,4-benzoquinol methylase